MTAFFRLVTRRHSDRMASLVQAVAADHAPIVGQPVSAEWIVAANGALARHWRRASHITLSNHL